MVGTITDREYIIACWWRVWRNIPSWYFTDNFYSWNRRAALKWIIASLRIRRVCVFSDR